MRQVLIPAVLLGLVMISVACEEDDEFVYDTPFYTGDDPSPTVIVPAGEFFRGSHVNANNLFGDNPEEGHYDEWPGEEVQVDEFQMEIYEVSNDQYRACVLAESCSEPQIDWSLTRDWYYTNPDYNDYPVLGVTWQQAWEYCAWLGRRLPTEAEWEKAARGGSDDRDWPWGPDQPTCLKTNYGEMTRDDQGNRYASCYGDTTPVGLFTLYTSPYGIYDMAGNAAEWVADWYAADYYYPDKWPDTLNNPQGPTEGEKKVVRGGSFLDGSGQIRVSYRDKRLPTKSSVTVGFRCAAD